MTNLEGVTAVVVTWNSGGLAERQLRALEPAFAAGLRMVLFDNGSVDGSPERLEAFVAQWPFAASVTLLRSDTNAGFCAGVNAATMAALGADPPAGWIWMLNADAEVTAGTAQAMLDVLRETSAGVVSPGLGDRHSIRVNAWPKMFWAPAQYWLAAVRHGRRWWRSGRYMGSCALFDAEAVRQLITRDGHFQDAALFMDGDELDVALRLRALGWDSVVAGEAAQLHPGGPRTLARTKVSKARQYYQSRNNVIVARRWLPRWQFWPLLGLRMARDHSWFARTRIAGHHPHPGAYLAGVRDALLGRTGRWAGHPPDNR